MSIHFHVAHWLPWQCRAHVIESCLIRLHIQRSIHCTFSLDELDSIFTQSTCFAPCKLHFARFVHDELYLRQSSFNMLASHSALCWFQTRTTYSSCRTLQTPAMSARRHRIAATMCKRAWICAVTELLAIGLPRQDGMPLIWAPLRDESETYDFTSFCFKGKTLLDFAACY